MFNKANATLLQIPKHHFAIIIIAWVLLQVFLIRQFGIITGFEATKYIDQANQLINQGHYESKNFVFYSTEILLIALCIKIKTGFWLVATIQMITNAFSIYLFYKLVDHFTAGKEVALIATLFFLGMYFYQLYNVYLFTESLFFSLSIVFAYILFTTKKLTVIRIVLVVLFLFLLAITRPTGILFIPPTFLFVVLRFARKRALPILVLNCLAGLIGFYFLLNTALDSGGEFDFLLPYIEEHIICGVPTIDKPNSLQLSVNKNSVEGLWYIVQHNGDLFFRLAKHRFIAFWGVQRSYYSTYHNVFVATYFYLVYLLIFIGIRKLFNLYTPQVIFMLAYILLTTLTVVLSCDEWHNRFLFAILPFLLLLTLGIFVKRQPK